MVVVTFVVIAQRFAVPYPVLLVLSGLGLSFVPHLPAVKLNPEIVFFFFLPALIYPAALNTSWRDFRRNLRPILLLAIGLVLITMLAVGWMAHAFAQSSRRPMPSQPPRCSNVSPCRDASLPLSRVKVWSMTRPHSSHCNSLSPLCSPAAFRQRTPPSSSCGSRREESAGDCSSDWRRGRCIDTSTIRRFKS